MILIKNDTATIELPLLRKCKRDRGHVYQLILQNRYTNEVLVYKVRDTFKGLHPLRLRFELEFPEWFDAGEYAYYLIGDGDWLKDDIDPYQVTKSAWMTDKPALVVNGLYLMSDGQLLVSSWLPSKVRDEEGDWAHIDGNFLVGEERSADDRVEHDAYRTLDILHTGLLKYREAELPIEVEPHYPEPRNKEYIQYKA